MVAAFTIGEHNTRDQYGKVTPFADVVLFCEAERVTIRDRIALWHKRSRAIVCKDQRDLVMVLPIIDFKVEKKLYFRAHKGRHGITPHRGTFVVLTRHRATGRKVAFLLEHRINAAFAPYKRGEGLFRAELWRRHTAMTLRVISHLKQENYTIFAGGDLNVPPDVQGYGGTLTEINTALDRLACSRDAHLTDFERLSPVGSDHHRIKATAHL